ncbi:triphosphoribosyl-dephospho-CoA synthase MdcB [Azospira restricta]|uniref:triphosphoribosyl-dephospho-CoA synthase n=1 Tax=Azospira restricta TaxID=404405 RepID=A0A974Y407_9RHOO|nr:triphosphoribosyl-dephospho-CoA synthase MdcB [Azospira restricta]QRJ64200.1 triphosphoribosyl-dephospho-CoA synthase MdcB [Azospira restricta]
MRRRLAGIGELAVAALAAELALDPKPGLVTPTRRGSHADMEHATFVASIDALRPYFADCAQLGAAGAGFAPLQARGLAAERAMFAATGGINTHKGAVFSLGLLAAAAGRLAARPAERSAGAQALGEVVRRCWGDDFATPPAAPSNGRRALREHGVPGAREHAAAGFPVLFAVTLPALQAALARGGGEREAGVHALLSTMAVLPDTNLVHRGGPAGLAWAQRASEAFVAAGSVFAAGWEARLAALCDEFERRWLSPGGAADLLAAAWFAHALPDELFAVAPHAALVA